MLIAVTDDTNRRLPLKQGAWPGFPRACRYRTAQFAGIDDNVAALSGRLGAPLGAKVLLSETSRLAATPDRALLQFQAGLGNGNVLPVNAKLQAHLQYHRLAVLRQRCDMPDFGRVTNYLLALTHDLNFRDRSSR